jgi:Fic family protein
METQDVVKKKTPKSFNKGLIELCFVQPYIKIEFVTERLGISRITASKYLKAMKKIGVLESKKVWKETIYINTRLFDLLRK